MKKIIALVLALVMVLSMATTAFAWQTNFKSIVANVAATALRGPALLMSYVLDDQQGAIVDGLNAALPAAYKVAERTMKSTNAALQLVTRLTNLRVNLDATVVKGAAKLAKNIMEDVKGDSGNSLLEGMISDTESFIGIVEGAQQGITKLLSNVARSVEVISDKMPKARIIEIIDELGDIFDDGESAPVLPEDVRQMIADMLKGVGEFLTTEKVSAEVKENVINAALIAAVASTFTVEDVVNDFSDINLRSRCMTLAAENLDTIMDFLQNSAFIDILMGMATATSDDGPADIINNLLTELAAIDNAAELADWMVAYIEDLVDDGNSTVSQVVENAINILTDVLGTSSNFDAYRGQYIYGEKDFPFVTAAIYWMLNGFEMGVPR